ncbi:hemoglobin/transferrin/lactoferrin receptor protein [Pseudomonas sp. BIGb0408]|uniref:Hemoglobin/transferrin/lactoferrin receptor protein n=1 Tax=Phytopseudomonas flavescens TaxID=29435 RepID=A0A7Y9XQU3_9GAMM|nr:MULTISPECIES: TonB-dependent receptor [Pseudomonas]MCW2290636.1 hemoglobin/transferrin/lactoferrin receptor protein [Pseudomonas sp. BIGb0408]NYH74791.1 hemoglobin/transferrin/lactoferrin receptor protein [Pseudomonas flavescens]
MHRCPYRLSLLGAMVAGSFMGQVQAQSAASSLELAPSSVTAVASERAETVEAEQIQRLQANDLQDVFESNPQVTVGGGAGIAQKLYLRGFEDTQLNITIDGASQAGQTFHHTGRIGIEPELLKRVEVQAGTGDATAGPGALGGAIRFVTKDPDDLLREGESFGALVKGGYFSNAEGYKSSTSLYGRFNENWSALAVASYQDQNDYEDGNNDDVLGTGARQKLGFTKLVGKLSESQTLRLSYEQRTDDGERSQRPQWIPSGFNRLYPMRSERETWTLNYAFKPLDNDLVDVELTAFHNEVELQQDGRFGLYFGGTRSSGFDLRNTSHLGRHTLTYGVDYRDDRGTLGPEGNREETSEDGSILGLYVQDSLQLTERLQIGAGLRYDRYKLDDRDDQRFREDGVSPNLSARYALTPELTLLAGHTRALRGPQVRDAFKMDSSRNDPNTKAERARTSEVGFEYRLASWELSGKLYETRIEDAVADPIGAPNVYGNIGDLKSEGVLLQTAYHWQRVSAGLSYHHNNARLDGRRLNVYEHNGQGTSLGDTWTTFADYRATDDLTVGWQGRFVESIDSVHTGQGTVSKPGYGVHDLYAEWLPLAADRLTLTLTLKNLFDKQYLDHASNEDFTHIPGFEGVRGSYEPGRELRLGVALRI